MRWQCNSAGLLEQIAEIDAKHAEVVSDCDPMTANLEGFYVGETMMDASVQTEEGVPSVSDQTEVNDNFDVRFLDEVYIAKCAFFEVKLESIYGKSSEEVAQVAEEEAAAAKKVAEQEAARAAEEAAAAAREAAEEEASREAEEEAASKGMSLVGVIPPFPFATEEADDDEQDDEDGVDGESEDEAHGRAVAGSRGDGFGYGQGNDNDEPSDDARKQIASRLSRQWSVPIGDISDQLLDALSAREWR